MIGADHPGYLFVEKRGLPQSTGELRQCVDDYIGFLLKESGQSTAPPINLDRIFNQFSLRVAATDFEETLSIDGINSAELGLILFDASAPTKRQRFTQAHELIECLVTALNGNRLSSTVLSYLKGARKERFCNWGAGRLLMPVKSFHPSVLEHGIGIATADTLARRYDTSFLATLWHMVNCYPRKRGFTIWQLAHKPRDRSSMTPANQTSLFEDGYRHAPPKELRAQWNVFGRQAARFQIPTHKSVSRDSLIFRAHEENQIRAGNEHVNLVHLKGEFFIEASPLTLGDERCVVSLFHWPESMFQERGSQAEII